MTRHKLPDSLLTTHCSLIRRHTYSPFIRPYTPSSNIIHPYILSSIPPYLHPISQTPIQSYPSSCSPSASRDHRQHSTSTLTPPFPQLFLSPPAPTDPRTAASISSSSLLPIPFLLEKELRSTLFFVFTSYSFMIASYEANSPLV